MKLKDLKASVILIGCGPHARRVYLPALQKLSYVELLLVVDLKSQEIEVQKALDSFYSAEVWLINPFSDGLPEDLEIRLSHFVLKHDISGVIIATEPLVHRAYADWALKNGLNILMDKPITARVDVTSKISSAKGILEDYLYLFEKYKSLQLSKETLFLINSHRRFHKGFQFVKELIRDVAFKTKCPVTFIQAYHSDGQWRLPNEIVTQEYHPYCFGYGKGSHSGYHIFDTVYQLYKSADLKEKLADSMEISSSFIMPNGFFKQLNREDYINFFGEGYNEVNKWTDEQLNVLCNDFGEIDLSSLITLIKNNEPIANLSINLVHNGFAGRTWLNPGRDLYKGNGRIKHESYYIQQGPFQSIQIHAYQGSDKHDEQNGLEEYLGGKNHFEIYVFRNPFVAGDQRQPEVYRMSDVGTNPDTESMITMEWVKFNVVKEFAQYISGRKMKDSIDSQIEDHFVPVQIMSGIYCSNIMRKERQSAVVEYSFGPVEQSV